MKNKYFRIPSVNIPLKESRKYFTKRVPVFEIGYFKEKLILFKTGLFVGKNGLF